jgi:murein DD-endopeptidase MepM/ murein hydrolase activator NlpD
MILKKLLVFFLSLFIFVGCKTVPKQLLFQAKTGTSYTIKNDTLHLKLDNPLKSPMRFYLSSSDSSFNARLAPYRQVILQSQTDSLITIAADSTLIKTLLINTNLGDPTRKPLRNKLNLPFSKGKTYRIVQAYDGTYSHNSPYSKYAIDFALKVGDTVCAADDGVVVGVISGYKYGGSDKKWDKYANYITLYHPHTGLYTQYVHLKQNGSLVQVGDTVKHGQPIGLSGKTGWTDIAHLHFNTLVAVPEGLMSVPVTFYGGIEGAALQPDDKVINTSGL